MNNKFYRIYYDAIKMRVGNKGYYVFAPFLRIGLTCLKSNQLKFKSYFSILSYLVFITTCSAIYDHEMNIGQQKISNKV